MHMSYCGLVLPCPVSLNGPELCTQIADSLPALEACPIVFTKDMHPAAVFGPIFRLGRCHDPVILANRGMASCAKHCGWVITLDAICGLPPLWDGMALDLGVDGHCGTGWVNEADLHACSEAQRLGACTDRSSKANCQAL